MENATDALKMAFAVFVFVMALTISITMFSQANKVSKAVLTTSDITTFYTYQIADDEEQSRIVGLETIIPTLYKYYKENYTVLFLDEYGKPLSLYGSQTNRELWGSGIDLETGTNPNAGIIAKYYTTNESNYSTFDNYSVCAFDVDEETIRHEPWTGTKTDFKKNLDAFLNGGIFEYPSGNGMAYNYKSEIGNGGFIKKYNNAKFKETLGEYVYNIETLDNEGEESSNELLKNKKKRVIIYQLQEN